MGFIGLEDTEILDDEAVEENIDEVKDYGARLKDFRLRLGDYDPRDLSPSPCNRSRIQTTLHVINPGKCTRNGVRRNELAPLLELVKQKHPSLALAMRITGRHGNMFDRIATLALDWRPRYRGQPLFYDMNGSEDAAFEMGSDVSIYSLSGSEYYSMSDEEGAAMDED
ncbi:hypothetical protein PInf_025891 [Phytophthora infestans]|nr:hypothetical protein PInf_025891 [Phytophthora infestans]